jgi:hypothetical protein
MRLEFFSVWRILGYCLIVMVVVLSLIPNPVVIPVENGDKVEHISAYTAMMVWFVWLYARWGERLLCAVLLALMGVGLEYLQGMTSHRTFDPVDMLANSGGVSLGLIVGVMGLPNALQWADRTIAKLVGQRVPS